LLLLRWHFLRQEQGQCQWEAAWKATAEELLSTWWWQKHHNNEKMMGDDGWRKKATHSYVELSYKKSELWQKTMSEFDFRHVRMRWIWVTLAVLKRHAPIPQTVVWLPTRRYYARELVKITFSPIEISLFLTMNECDYELPPIHCPVW
jgi:hypothetical protein